VQSPDLLSVPVREESTELARELLANLRRLADSDKRPLDEIIKQSTTQERLELAGQIEEITDAYRNLLAEAVEFNPLVLDNPLIKDANLALSGFAHSLKLLAALEMPGSVAATQQISAAQSHDGIDHLHNRTLDRLVENMEGGLERAVESVEAQEQQQQHEQQQEEEDLQAAAEQAQQSGKNRKRRRRRSASRSSGGGGGATKASKRRNSNDLNGDGVSDALQNLNLGALNERDMLAIKQLGGSLKAIGDQVRSMNLNEVSNTLNDSKIKPDEIRQQGGANANKTNRNPTRRGEPRPNR
jgi:hypothetical protein